MVWNSYSGLKSQVLVKLKIFHKTYTHCNRCELSLRERNSWVFNLYFWNQKYHRLCTLLLFCIKRLKSSTYWYNTIYFEGNVVFWKNGKSNSNHVYSCINYVPYNQMRSICKSKSKKSKRHTTLIASKVYSNGTFKIWI